MARIEPSYGLKPLTARSTDHAIVLLHGIRQTLDDIAAPLGKNLARYAKSADVYVYGYNHTLPLMANGTILAEAIDQKIKAKRIDLVGYSMGGLVARLAATDRYNLAFHTVVTLATPNRGSLSNAELTTLGTIGRGVFEFLSPLAPRMAGVKDLTRVTEIMSERRDRLLKERKGKKKKVPVATLRYASIPALFYNPRRTNFTFGPSIQLSALQAAIFLVGLKRRLVAMQRPHDGIVTEASNNVTASENYDWSELDLVQLGPGGEPARCHVVLDICRDHDHGSILRADDVALLIWSILDCADWRQLEGHRGELGYRVRAALS